MAKGEGKPKSKTLGIISIVLGAISFIPLIGLFTGIAAVIIGIIDIAKNKSKLGIIGLVLGILGILLTIGIYGALIYYGFMQRGGVYDDLRIKMTQEKQFPDTINAIESYKVRYGSYPENITELEKVTNDPLIYFDQLQIARNIFNSVNNTDNAYFYYEKKGNTYFLFSKGVDGIAFTQDDVFPLENSTINTGYRHP